MKLGRLLFLLKGVFRKAEPLPQRGLVVQPQLDVYRKGTYRRKLTLSVPVKEQG